MTEEVISLISRKDSGTGQARKIRREGYVPGILYGDNKENISVAIEERIMAKLIKNARLLSHRYHVAVDKSKPVEVLIKNLQIHPVSDRVLSIDLLRVNARTKTTVAVPVEFSDAHTAEIIKMGGILMVLRYEIELFGPIANIPETLVLTIGNRQIGDVIRLSEITLPKGVKSVIDRDITVASILAPKISNLADEKVEEEPEEESTESTES